jgi:hypothetical protein
LIWLADTGEADRASGAFGTVCGVVAVAVLENELPAVLKAATR